MLMAVSWLILESSPSKIINLFVSRLSVKRGPFLSSMVFFLNLE